MRRRKSIFKQNLRSNKKSKNKKSKKRKSLKKKLKSIKKKFSKVRQNIRQRNADIYCGNNRLHPSVVNGNAIIGTRNRCFKRGFGRGYHSPVDPDYDFNYEPIDDRRIFCGNGNELPEGYDRLGNLPHCLLKGYGVGRRKRHEDHFNNNEEEQE